MPYYALILALLCINGNNKQCVSSDVMVRHIMDAILCKVSEMQKISLQRHDIPEEWMDGRTSLKLKTHDAGHDDHDFSRFVRFTL